MTTHGAVELQKPEKPWHLRPWYQRHKGKLIAAGIVLGVITLAVVIGATGGLAAPAAAAGAAAGFAIGATVTGVSATAALASIASTASVAIMTGGAGYDIKRKKEVGRALEPRIKTREDNLKKNIKRIKQETADEIKQAKTDTSKNVKEIKEKIKTIKEKSKLAISEAKKQTKAEIKNLRDEEARVYAERLENYNRQQAEKKKPTAVSAVPLKKDPTVDPEQKTVATEWKKSKTPSTVTNIKPVTETQNPTQSADETLKVRGGSASLGNQRSESKKEERRIRSNSYSFDHYKTNNPDILKDPHTISSTHLHDSAEDLEADNKKTENKKSL